MHHQTVCPPIPQLRIPPRRPPSLAAFLRGKRRAVVGFTAHSLRFNANPSLLPQPHPTSVELTLLGLEWLVWVMCSSLSQSPQPGGSTLARP